MSVDPLIPRLGNPFQLRADPLAFLKAAQPAEDGLVVISEHGPIFSRARDCSGAVAVFGQPAVRQVLNDAEAFGTAVSVAELFSLPPRLRRLNAGLFSMRGEQHKSHQQMLRLALGTDAIGEYSAAIVEGWNGFAQGVRPEQEVHLLSEMRRLALHVSERIIFGDADFALGSLIQSYFDCRRSLSGRREPIAPVERRELIRMGSQLDRMLCARLVALRNATAARDLPSRCLVARMMKLVNSAGEPLTDDELIAHGNVLFMSSSEPIAVALTWTLLLLSQQPELRCALREELSAASNEVSLPTHVNDVELPLLKAVIQESLRLLPPSAIIVRLTTRPVRVLGYELPARCEVILSPFVAHRDYREFANPDTFDPDRWRTLKPSAYAYFPFGGGARYCVGRQLASFILFSILARILIRYDVVLASDQDLNWTVNITMMPASEPVVKFLPLSALRAAARGARLGGPVAALVHF